MRLTLRAKLVVIAAMAAIALAIVAATSIIAADQVNARLIAIRVRHVPKVELRPRLEGEFERMRRSFQDAVAAQDVEALEQAGAIRDRFLRILAAARNAVDGRRAAALRRAVQDYYGTALGVSRRLIADETGEDLVDAMTAMQAKHARVALLIDRTTSLRENELNLAFSDAEETQRAATRALLWTSMACVLLATFLSWWLGRSVLRSVAELTGGFARFGRGEFQVPIVATGRDELSDVATSANEMARSLDELGKETRTLLAATQAQAARLIAQDEALRATNDDLQKQATALATVSAYKSQFLANMSHELRTPLNSMLLLSDLLAENESCTLTPKQVEQCTIIHCAGVDLLALINEVLDLSKIEAGKQDLRIETLPLRQLAGQLAGIFEPLSSHKGLQFSAEIDSSLPTEIATDRQRITQVLNNLLGNAIKFTERGEVRLRIVKPSAGTRYRRPDLRSDDAVAFEVSDTGMGISQSDQERIFEPFEQADVSSDRRHGGTGLGLAIAREIAALLGGEIELVSQPGEGSKFTLHLPFSAPSSRATEARPSEPIAVTPPVLAAASPVASSEAIEPNRPRKPVRPSDTSPVAAQLAGRTILVVDDDMRTVYALSAMLRSKGADVLVGDTGRAALAVLGEHADVDAVLIDIMMPEMDGYEAMRRIREQTRYREMPIIALTAKSMRDDEQRCMEAGASAYLPKPIDLQELFRLLASRLDGAIGGRA